MLDFGTLKTTDLRLTWKHEDDDFTPWLSENLTLLRQGVEYEP